ncbi:MAG TPA: BON domain-containing protein [Blastocatellia bacterium]|nr:BON domain-containing protein [Blastocatellia bacterium]
MQRPRHIAVTLTTLFLLALVFPAYKCGDKAPRRTDIQIKADREITSEVRRRLTASPIVRAVDLDIDTVNLKVTLSGAQDSEAAKADAVRIAGEVEVEISGQKFKVREVDASNVKLKPSQ